MRGIAARLTPFRTMWSAMARRLLSSVSSVGFSQNRSLILKFFQELRKVAIHLRATHM